jgi:hypothetical protein
LTEVLKMKVSERQRSSHVLTRGLLLANSWLNMVG